MYEVKMTEKEFQQKMQLYLSQPLPLNRISRTELELKGFHEVEGWNGDKGFGCEFEERKYQISKYKEYHNKMYRRDTTYIYYVDNMWHICDGYDDDPVEEYRSLEELICDHYGIILNDTNCKFCGGEPCPCACIDYTQENK